MSVYYEFFPKALYVLQLYENGQVGAPLDNGGFMMTKEEWEQIKNAFDEFYKTDAYLEHNKKRQQELGQRKESHYGEMLEIPKKPNPKPGYIYFVKAVESGHIKIGYTTNLKTRIKSMQTASPFQLELVASYESFGIQEEEALAHEYFKYHRVRGEWFEITDNNIFKFIEEREREING